MNSETDNEIEAQSDEKLALLAGKGDVTALNTIISRYAGIVNSRAAGYFGRGLEPEDFAQEGMIGLVKAVRTFNPERGASFHTYAILCIDSGIISAVRSALALHKVPENEIVSIDRNEDDKRPVSETLGDEYLDPEKIVMSMENIRLIYADFEKLLSSLERRVLILYMGGCGYDVIADRLSISEKSVDNALCRARSKLKNRKHSVS